MYQVSFRELDHLLVLVGIGLGGFLQFVRRILDPKTEIPDIRRRRPPFRHTLTLLPHVVHDIIEMAEVVPYTTEDGLITGKDFGKEGGGDDSVRITTNPSRDSFHQRLVIESHSYQNCHDQVLSKPAADEVRDGADDTPQRIFGLLLQNHV